MPRLEHPAYALGRGRPGSVPLTPAYQRLQADVDDDGYFEVETDHVDAVRARLAETYEVEYDGADVVVPEDHEEVASDSGDTSGDSAGGEPPDESTSGDSAADTYSRSDLDTMERERLKEIYLEELDGDRDEVDLRKPNELVAGILRMQADADEEA